MRGMAVKTFALSLLILLGSCSGPDGNEADCLDRPVAFKSPSVNEPAYCQNLSSTLAIKDRMGQPAGNFAPGEEITFEASVTNNSSSAITVTKSSGCPQLAFEAYRSTFQTDWFSADGEVCTQALVDVTYAPGETRLFTAQWQQKLCGDSPAPSGQYTVRTQDTTQCWARIDKSAGFTIQ